jgi:hypothetical protein
MSVFLRLQDKRPEARVYYVLEPGPAALLTK